MTIAGSPFDAFLLGPSTPPHPPHPPPLVCLPVSSLTLSPSTSSNQPPPRSHFLSIWPAPLPSLPPSLLFLSARSPLSLWRGLQCIVAAFLSGPGWDSTRRKQSGRGNGEQETRRNTAAAAAAEWTMSTSPAEPQQLQQQTRCDESLKTSAGVVKILATGVCTVEGQRLALFSDILFFFALMKAVCVCEDLKYEFFKSHDNHRTAVNVWVRTQTHTRTHTLTHSDIYVFYAAIVDQWLLGIFFCVTPPLLQIIASFFYIYIYKNLL